MLKYCLKVFDSEGNLKMQIIVPKEELMFHVDNLSSYGTVKGFVIDESDSERNL